MASIRRRTGLSLQAWLGGIALASYLAAVVAALEKVIPVGFVFVSLGGVVSVVALGVEYREHLRMRKAVTDGNAQVFRPYGTFGAPRSSQTHVPML
jgi:hypothetical protein